MRVSVLNFCSTAVEMLDFSSKMLVENAGTDDFDYIIVTWNPSQEVKEWIAFHKEEFSRFKDGIVQVNYYTNMNFAYVPNLRLMMNHGFDAGYKLNDWVVIVNTDMMFGSNWLHNLVRRAKEDTIPNSLHLTPITGPNVITVNLGIPTFSTFDFSKFWELHNTLFEEKIETEEQRGGWRACATMPYVLHRKWWEKCGPWEPEVGEHNNPPDQRFFERCHDAGAKFVLVHDSIVYHHEAVERRSGRRPLGVENMKEGC